MLPPTALSGESINAQEALSLGLVDSIDSVDEPGSLTQLERTTRRSNLPVSLYGNSAQT